MKLTAEKVKRIRAQAGARSQRAIATDFGITQSAVSRIVSKGRWKQDQPVPGKPAHDLADRFWSKVRRTADGCWLWTGWRDKRGYGQLLIGSRRDGTRRVERASRVAWQLVNGSIPDGLNVCHHCDNPPCVRVSRDLKESHLFLGTDADNMGDMHAKGRHKAHAPSGAAHHGAKLNASQIAAIRRRYRRGDVSQERLATEFGISQTQVSRIVRGKRWRASL